MICPHCQSPQLRKLNWLGHHGRQNLIDRYGDVASLQEVFKLLLRRTARNPGVFTDRGTDLDVGEHAGYEWNTNRYGPGILDVEALLNAELPEPEEARTVNPDNWVHTTWRETMYGLYQSCPN